MTAAPASSEVVVMDGEYSACSAMAPTHTLQHQDAHTGA